jgi:hypothetical protein
MCQVSPQCGAREILDAEVKQRSRIRLTIRQGIRVLQR